MDDLISRLRNSVGSWLNADVIDWQGPQLVDEAVDGVLSGLYPLSNSERATLKRTMIQMLSEWEATVDWFNQVTDVDWTFDARTAQVLKAVITKLSQSFEPYASP